MDNEHKIYSKRIATREDVCIKCHENSLRKRRKSTIEPSTHKCYLGCNYDVYEIHMACLDCSERENKCPWCLVSPWIKYKA